MKNILKKNQKLSNDSKVLEENFFDKRKEVLSIIYKAKKLYPNAPRTEVKITSKDGGLGWVNKNNCIAIGIDTPKSVLIHMVLHELVHTWFKHHGHNDLCSLMKPHYNPNGESEDIAWSVFKDYIKKYTKDSFEGLSIILA